MESLIRLARRRTLEHRQLPNGDQVEIDALMIDFSPHRDRKLPAGSTYFLDPSTPLPGSYLIKPLVDVGGAPLFGELAIARCLESEGWSAVWIDSYHGHGNRLCWRDLPDRSEPYDFADAHEAAAKFDQITSANGGTGGWFDVMAWRKGEFLFVEYKGAGDKSNVNEKRWIASALQSGVKASELHFVLSESRAVRRSESLPRRQPEMSDDCPSAGGTILSHVQHSHPRELPPSHSGQVNDIAPGNERMSNPDPDAPTQEFTDDGGYFSWVQTHRDGYVLSVRRGKPPLLHRATCTHIDRHNNPGALTERGAQKICSESKRALRDWVREHGLGSGVALEKCSTCGP